MIKRKRKKNPIHLKDLKTNKKVYWKNRPFYIYKIRLGGIVEIISEDENEKHTVNVNELESESKESFKQKYGFSKLDEPVYVELDRYILSKNENRNLGKLNAYLDFMIYRKLNGNKDPITGWFYDGTLESLNTGKPINEVTSNIEYDKKGDAFNAAQRMIAQKLGILVPNSIQLYEHKIVEL